MIDSKRLDEWADWLNTQTRCGCTPGDDCKVHYEVRMSSFELIELARLGLWAREAEEALHYYSMVYPEAHGKEVYTRRAIEALAALPASQREGV